MNSPNFFCIRIIYVKHPKMEKLFRKFAQKVSSLVGAPISFILAIIFIASWLATGPLFEFSDTWQLVINTLTTVITFLMVFLIQNTQNRDSKMLNIKIDELIKALKSADDKTLDLDDLSDDQLEDLEKSFKQLAHEEKI